MKKFLLVVLFLFLVNIAAQAQSKKVEKLTEKLAGTWVFDSLVFSSEIDGIVTQSPSDVFHIDTVYFYEDHSFRLIFMEDSSNYGAIESGCWHLKKSGKETELHLVDRKEKCYTYNSPGRVVLPLKKLNKNFLRLDFMMTIQFNSPDSESETKRTPVFFKKLR